MHVQEGRGGRGGGGNGWKDGNNEIERRKNGEERESFLKGFFLKMNRWGRESRRQEGK